MNRKVAIVLRGAMGTGKSDIWEKLQKHFGEDKSECVVLDIEWGLNEKRSSTKTPATRYQDLINCREFLIIELGYGEPLDKKSFGATKNPQAWIKLLEQGGREIFFFLLEAKLRVCLQRKYNKEKLSAWDIGYIKKAWDRYAPGRVCSHEKFSYRIGNSYKEVEIDTNQDCNQSNEVKKILRAVDPPVDNS